MSQHPTKTQKQDVYSYVCAYKSAHDGNSPTYRQIQEACGISSTGMVHYRLHRLQEQGLIELRQVGTSMVIIVKGGSWSKS